MKESALVQEIECNFISDENVIQICFYIFVRLSLQNISNNAQLCKQHYITQYLL